MNPNTALQTICDDLENEEDPAETNDVVDSLREWLLAGGYCPRVTSDQLLVLLSTVIDRLHNRQQAKAQIAKNKGEATMPPPRNV
jgi:hypothetical protein